MIEALLMGGAMGAQIKSIQSGYQSSSTTSIPINEVDPAKSILLFTPSAAAGMMYAQALNPTSISVGIGGFSTVAPINWQVIEFSGIKRVQSGLLTMSSSDSGETATIESVDIDNSFLIIGCVGVGTSPLVNLRTATANQMFVRSTLSQSSVYCARTIYSSDESPELKIFYQVIEF